MTTISRLEEARREVDARFRALIDAQRKSARATEARSRLPAGSSRARVTTANARWMRAAEYRDLCDARLRELVPGLDSIAEWEAANG